MGSATSGTREYGQAKHMRKAVTRMRRLGYVVEADYPALSIRWQAGRQPVVPGDRATVRAGPHAGLRGTVESVSTDGIASLRTGEGRTVEIPVRVLHS